MFFNSFSLNFAVVDLTVFANVTGDQFHFFHLAYDIFNTITKRAIFQKPDCYGFPALLHFQCSIVVSLV